MGPTRSNIAVAESDPTLSFDGDTFILPASGSWRIDSIVIWSVASIFEPLGNEFSDVGLYLRQQGGTFDEVENGTPGTSFGPGGTVSNSNPNISHNLVTYSNGQPYVGVGGSGVYPLWRTTFSNLNYYVDGGQIVEFGVAGTGTNPDPDTLYGYWFTEASNRLLSGNPQPGADGVIMVYDFANLAGPGYSRMLASDGTWNKNADINILIFATLVPEPSSLTLIGLGLAGTVLLARRRSHKAKLKQSLSTSLPL